MNTACTAPVFIVGTPRSGTTLTAQILGRHSRIFTGGENHFFEEIYSRRDELGDPGEPGARRRILERLATMYGRQNQPVDQESFTRLMADGSTRKRLEASTSYRELLTTMMELLREQAGKARWGNNTPKDVFWVREILSFYPDARFLLCVRDVRDFLLSYKNQWRSKDPEQSERLRKLYHPIVTSLVWKSTVRRVPELLSSVPGPNRMIVRYESLVSAPEETTRRMCEVVGEPFEPDMLAVDSHNSSHARSEKGIFSTSVGGWRAGLDPEEVYLAQRLNRQELELLGYEREPTTAGFAGVARLVLTFPWSLGRAVRANSDHRGPLGAYLSRRARALVRS